jgi:putative toxin-antitoxin system antitoxin component (TIGR02293 family)
MTISISTTEKTSVKQQFRSLRIQTPHALTLAARKGLKPQLFYDLANVIRMPEKFLAGIINLSARTLSNYALQKKLLEPIYSEHLLKLISLYEKGELIFGNVDEFNYWLKKPFWDSKEKPIDWLITPGGVDLLAEELDKLAQGYPV